MLKLTDQEFKELTTYVHNNYGIDLSKKRVLIEGRLSNTLMAQGYKSFSDYFQVLYADKTGNQVIQLINKLTTNYTYFMRENEHFEFLTNKVLPYLEKNRKNKTLYIWSAGCSSGQEPYSMAMAISEYFGARKGEWNTTILASDLSANVLEKAANGVYTEEEIKDIPPAWASKHLVKLKNGDYRVSEAIRKEVVFRRINLMEPFHFKNKFDLIFCRNVMIYFDGPTKEALVNKYYDWTADNGFLFIGHSESINREATKYSYIQPAIYQKRGAK
ncbi:MAG: protein-glutamate O-methyltransferase CheR [Oscillospiraceae bacterium]|nr:protein-glutamate O-methyltransferase CheR [Oscillospiraceae bacterium]